MRRLTCFLFGHQKVESDHHMMDSDEIIYHCERCGLVEHNGYWEDWGY